MLRLFGDVHLRLTLNKTLSERLIFDMASMTQRLKMHASADVRKTAQELANSIARFIRILPDEVRDIELFEAARNDV